VDILRSWSSWKLTTSGLGVSQQLKALSDGTIAGVKLGSTSIGVNRISDLIVAALI
jgi:hypothetical protein